MITDRVVDIARLRDLEQQHFAQVLARASNVFVDRGQGSYLFTPEGRRILDFTMGIATMNTGHSHPRVIAAAKNQIDRLVHPSATAVHYGPNIELTAKLADITPGELNVTFLTNSGAEAVEAALKLAKYATGRPGIIAFLGGFHGRTIGALSVTTSKAYYRERYDPLVPATYFAPFPHAPQQRTADDQDSAGRDCLRTLEQILEQQVDPYAVAAMLVEPIQGEGGYIVPPPSFLQGLRTMCDRYGMLLIFDEVQTGFGRTGKWWASQHFDVVPDVQVMAKAIASGFPLSAVSSTKQIMDTWLPGAHGSTFGGNPVSCAAACATIEVIAEEGLLANAATQGTKLQQMLRNLQAQAPQIGEVRGLGLMVACEFVQEDGSPNGRAATAVQRECLDHDLLLLTCGPHDQTIRFMPPLNVAADEVEMAVHIFAEAVATVARAAP